MRQSPMRHSLTNQKGFTISELIVVITVLGILTGIVMTTLGDYYQANTTSLGKTTQDTDTRTVLHTIESSASDADAFLPSLTVAAPTGPTNNTTNNTWSFKGIDTGDPATRNRVLITTSTLTDKPAEDDTRLPVFTCTVGGGVCNIDSGTIAKYYYVYFVAPDRANPTVKSLYRRTIVPNQTYYDATGAATTPSIKTSCLPSVIAANPSICKGSDALILSNINTFKVDYYGSPNDADPLPDIYNDSVDNSGSVTNAKVAKITVTTSQRIDGKLSTSQSEIRISRSY